MIKVTRTLKYTTVMSEKDWQTLGVSRFEQQIESEDFVVDEDLVTEHVSVAVANVIKARIYNAKRAAQKTS